MPISVAEMRARGFEVHAFHERMFWYLQQHPREAFTPYEVAEAVGVAPAPGALNSRNLTAAYLAVADAQDALLDWSRRGLIMGRWLMEGDGTVQVRFAANAGGGP